MLEKLAAGLQLPVCKLYFPQKSIAEGSFGSWMAFYFGETSPFHLFSITIN